MKGLASAWSRGNSATELHPYAHLSDDHRKLLRKYGLNSPDAATRQRRYAIHKARVAKGNPKNLDVAMRLASVRPDQYGKKKAGKKKGLPTPKTPLSKAEYDKQLLKTKDAVKRQALRDVRKASRRAEVDKKLAQRQRMKKIRKDMVVKTNTFYDASNSVPKKLTGRQVVSRSVMSRNTLSPELASRKSLADGLTQIVTGMDELFRSVHSSLSELLHDFIKTNLGARAAKGIKVGGTLATALVPKDVYTFAIRKVLQTYGADLDENAFQNELQKADYKKVVVALAAGRKRVDLVPLVRGTVMALDPGSVQKLTKALADEILGTYVRQKYTPTAGPSTICLLCKGRPPTCPRGGSPPDPKAFANGIRKMLFGLNKVLKAAGTNLTREAREAIKTYAVDLDTTSGWLTGRVAVAFSPGLAKIIGFLHCAVSKVANRWGFEVSLEKVREVVVARSKDLRALVDGKGGDIENFIVDIVRAVRPTDKLSLCRVCHMKCDSSFKLSGAQLRESETGRRGSTKDSLQDARAQLDAVARQFRCVV